MPSQPTPYAELSQDALAATVVVLEDEVAALKAKGLNLDMARGKPSPEQVNLSRGLLDALTSESSLEDDGVDAANYGAPYGLPSARKLMASLIDVDPEWTLVAGSSSLNLMHDCFTHAYLFGVMGAEPWSRQAQEQELKFLCPSPGYDRHFAVSAHFGLTNIPVEMTPEGPHMDQVEELVKDPAVKGIWCVPKYQNPCGCVFSPATVERFAALKPAASDFRIFWDNAYVVHDLTFPAPELVNIFEAAAAHGTQDRIYEFTSTSKITFPGSGIAALAATPANLKDLMRSFGLERVCSDKMTQLAHVRYFSSKLDVLAHMRAQAEHLAPRFVLVEQKLTAALAGLAIATWTHPAGGYFVSFDTLPGCAREVVELCAATGVKLTPAGATWPYGRDPKDTNIRLAPSYPTLGELAQALDVFCACVKLVSARHLLAQRQA
jgi:aspartate/methionine/tyrosine aminotransferase